MSVSIKDLKRQLNVEFSYTDENAILQRFLDIANIAVLTYCNEGLSGYTGTTEQPLPVQQSVILLATHFYINRNMVSFGQGTEIPYSFRFLLDPYKNFIIQ